VGLLRFLSIPVLDSGRVVAAIGVANKDADYDDDDVMQLSLLMGSAWKVVARMRAEAALRNSEQRYRRLFEAAKDGILIIDAENGRVVDVNPFLVALLGYSREEFLEKNVWDLGPFKDVIASQQAFHELQREELVRYDDLTLETHDGRRIDVEFISNLYSVDQVKVIQCNIRDISDRLKAEKERASLESQLQKSQRLEAIGQLAGGVAHDFNNLLTVINNYAGFAIEELREADPVRADLEEILKAGQRAAGLTRQLLAFSRKQLLAPQVLSLNGVVAGIEGMLRRLIGEDIHIATSLAGDLGTVEADPGQIEQVIVNLAINARDAMPGGGKLTISTANVTLDEDYATQHSDITPGEFVLLSVADNGCGMDEETRNRVFEPFFTTKEKGKGTGLGLATVYGIVRQSGGNILIYSEPDLGSTFKVYLPRVDAAPSKTQRPLPVEAIGHETVLIVEDEDGVRRLAKRILKAAGYQVLTAANGGEALLLCEQSSTDIHLLLTDVVMPQMSGKQLTERLALIRPEMKVLYMSGYTDDAIVHHGVLASGIRFIGKPFTGAALTTKVREALDDTK
jgi:PAS domain S-box-containing protein